MTLKYCPLPRLVTLHRLHRGFVGSIPRPSFPDHLGESGGLPPSILTAESVSAMFEVVGGGRGDLLYGKGGGPSSSFGLTTRKGRK